jgi:4-hydroxy-tetrahydrodipicolinate synthase
LPHSAHAIHLVQGVFAAMTIPRSFQGQLDVPALRRHLLFLADKGITGFALNGATGEYCLTSEADLTQMLQTARETLGTHATLLAGIGGANDLQSLRLLRVAERKRADGVLLPMPHYFPYAQEDLTAFVEKTVAKASLPVLLYNLPSFTSNLEPATSADLIRKLDRLVGIKDSSGQLDTVRLLTAEMPSANRIIGNDEALYDALKQRLCDGVISGVACVLPELMLSLYRATEAKPSGAEALQLRDLLDEFIAWLTRFPVPWGLKIIAEERGLGSAVFPIPLSAKREQDRRILANWFAANRSSLLANDSLAAAAH